MHNVVRGRCGWNRRLAWCLRGSDEGRRSHKKGWITWIGDGGWVCCMGRPVCPSRGNRAVGRIGYSLSVQSADILVGHRHRCDRGGGLLSCVQMDCGHCLCMAGGRVAKRLTLACVAVINSGRVASRGWDDGDRVLRGDVLLDGRFQGRHNAIDGVCVAHGTASHSGFGFGMGVSDDSRPLAQAIRVYGWPGLGTAGSCEDRACSG